MSFTRIFYDSKNNKIYHWYLDEDGKTRREEFHPEIEYYIKGKSGDENSKFDIFGNPVTLQTTKNRFNLKEIKMMGTTYEADMPEDIKFLQKRYGNQNLKVQLDHFQIATIDIEVQADGPFEGADQPIYPINLISVHFSKQDEIHTFGLHPYTGDSDLVKNYHYCADERTLIRKFILLLRKAKVSIISGWFSRLFDIPYIIKRCEILKIEESMSPIGIYREKNAQAGYHIDGGGYEIAGIAILDGLDLYKNFEREKRQSYSLNAIGMIECKEGKLEFEGSINDLWGRDWNKYVEYNIQDVLLTKKINDKKRYIELAINFCYQALVPFEKIFSSVNLVTGFMIKYLHSRNMVLPDKDPNITTGVLTGAYVMAMNGMHKWCMSFDVQSMYPHLLMRFNISPETQVMFPANTEGLISTPVEGVFFRKDKVGVLAQLVSDIFDDRIRNKNKYEVCKRLEAGMNVEQVASDWGKSIEMIKELKEESEKEQGNARYYDSHQYIRKILANSIYGCVGNEHFAFYNLNNARVVTVGGQTLIKFLSKTINEYFQQNINQIIKRCFPHITKKIELTKPVCVLVDTDSNYLCFDEIIEKLGIKFNDMMEFRNWALTLNEKIFDPFFEKILKIFFARYNIDKTVNFKKEKMISKMIILAKKKYAMKVIDNEGDFYENPDLKFTGIEIVRTDTPTFCRSHLRLAIDELFDTENRSHVINKIREIHEKYMTASVDQLALAKGVKNYSKYAPEPMSDLIENKLVYPKACPIHVRASMNYNYYIEKYKLSLMQINNGTKMKFVFVKPNNELRQNVVGFVGNWPKEFDNFFEVDRDELWTKTFQATMQRFFDVMDWGEIRLQTTAFEEFGC